MSDTELRDLERAWRADLTEESAERYLEVRLRGYDLPIRRLIETAIRSERLFAIGIGAEERKVSASNVVEYLLGVPVASGEKSDAELRLARLNAEMETSRAQMRAFDQRMAVREIADVESYRAETRVHTRPRKILP